MTLDKKSCRAMLEEYFTDYGPDQRFELHMEGRSILFLAQAAKERIPHPHQKVIDNAEFSLTGVVDGEI